MPRPLVPGRRVVAGAISRRAQRERSQCRSRSRVTVGDDLGALGATDPRLDLRRRARLARAVEQLDVLEADGARDVALPWVARVAALAAELVLGAGVEQRQLGIVQSARQ